MLKFKKKLHDWDYGLPLGNGTVGCLLWNDNPLKFSIDRADLWDTTPSLLTLREDFTYENMVNLIKGGEFAKMNSIFDKCYSNITPTKILGGRIEISFDGEVESVNYELDRKNPIAVANLRVSGRNISVKTFVHAEDNIGLILVEGCDNETVEVVRPDYGIKGENSAVDQNGETIQICNGKVSDLSYPAPEIICKPELKGFIQCTNEDLKYALLVKRKAISNGSLYAYTIEKGKKDQDLSYLETKLDSYLEQGFEASARKHLEWWNNYYGMSDIEISDNELQAVWDTGNYLLACVSRSGSAPMPLQGVFTADNGVLPPWKGDYHNDTNTQMSYYSYMKANHIEQGESFIRFLTDLIPRFKKFATEFYDAPDGIAVPGVMAADGTPLGGWAIYALSITMSIWLCRNFEDYYNYTLADGFLENTLYPFMSGIEKTVARWLVLNDNGRLQLNFSSTPEWRDNSPASCFFDANTNFDLMLLHYLYEKLCKYSELLGDTHSFKYYTDTKAKLADYHTDDTGFMLAKELPLTVSHRHLSHLMGVHPLRTIKYEGGNKDLINRSVKHLQKLGVYYWVGFSFASMAAIYTVMKNGEAAASMLRIFWETTCLPNGFHCNGDYKRRGYTIFEYHPVTLEANMGAMDAVQEMLLYGEDGKIEVFPAIPEYIAEQGAKFTNLRVEGAALVSSSIKDGKVEFITVTALKGGRFDIKLQGKMKCSCEKGIISIDEKDCEYLFEQGETITLELV